MGLSCDEDTWCFCILIVVLLSGREIARVHRLSKHVFEEGRRRSMLMYCCFLQQSFRRDRVIELSLLIPAPESRRFARIEISVAQYMVFWFFFFFFF